MPIDNYKYFYIKTNKDWNYENKVKYGVTNDLYTRLINNSEHSTYRYNYLHVFEIKEIKPEYYNYFSYKAIDKIFSIYCKNKTSIFPNLKKYLIDNEVGAGQEFINKDGLELLLLIIKNDFIKIGIIIEELNVDNINKILINEYNITNIVDKITNDVDNIINELDKINNNVVDEIINNKITNEIINELDKINDLYKSRDYQIIIIDYLYKSLLNNKPIYLELSTGAGKSYIAYQLFIKFKPNNIIIFSPLKSINKQNISDNYFNLLNNNYIKIDNFDKFNYNKDFNYVFSICINSYKKVYDIINNNNLNNIFIWFDEADYGIENWIDDLSNDIHKNFLLTDNNNIKYRLFTSASPNKEVIIENSKYFGELYNPISIKELTKQKYLSKIKVYILEFEKKLNKKEYVQFMLKEFIKKKRNLGISSHTTCDNAYKLFIEHYELFRNNKTTIKPFLLINQEKINELKISDTIDLGDINDFTNGIGYIVNQYSRGYDNKFIDIIFISDPKNSYKSNIQLIGRGIRPHEDKHLDLIIPTNYDNLQKEYSNVEETLKYIINNIEIDYDDIFRRFISNKNNDKTTNLENDDEEDNYNEKCKIINTILLNICKNHKWSVKGLITQLKIKNIHNNIDYMKYKNRHKYLNFPDNIYEKFPIFTFYDTYRTNENPYISKEEIINIINNNKDNINKFYKDEDKMNYIYSLTDKIPKGCSLWNFYGGNRNDYFYD
jgi:superfamily II DNA or RNA helicase